MTRVRTSILKRLFTARAFFRDPVGYVAEAEDCPVVSLAAGMERFAVVRDPVDVRRVLVVDAPDYRVGKWKARARRFLGDTLNTLDGAEHRRRRLALRPALERQRIGRFTSAIVQRIEREQGRWRDGTRLDLRNALDPLSLVIAGDVLLSEDLEPVVVELAAALADVMTAVPRLSPPLRFTARGRALSRVDRTLTDLIARRRAAPRRSPEPDPSDRDLLDALLALNLSDRLVRGELTAFLLASADEPPSALAAIWFLLGHHPDVERRLLDELDTVLAGRVPTLADEPQLPYLGAVVREALRLFPPARHIDRCPVRDVHFGSTRVPAGTQIIVSPLVLHHDPRSFPDPSAFKPERWLNLQDDTRPRGAYIPFGAGAHSCIGEPLAHAIIWLTLATVCRRWRLRVDADAPLPVPRAPRLIVTLEQR